MKFKDLRKVLSRIDRISICDKKTLTYKNFLTINDVPKEYDSLTVLGVGLIDSEFYKVSEGVYSTKKENGELSLVPCIEVYTTGKKKKTKGAKYE